MSPDLRRSRAAVLAAFFAQGFVFLSLTTRLPTITDRAGVGALGLSGLLLMMVLLAGAGSVGAELAAKRTPSAPLLRLGLVLIAVGVPVIVLAPGLVGLIPGLALYGVGLGLVDATTNMQAVAVEAAYDRPLLPSFHGAWTLGGVVASVLALATAALPWTWTAAVAIVPAVIAAAPFLPRAAALDTSADETPIPWRPIVLVGLGMVVFYMVDTAATTWGPTFLHDTVRAPQGLIALATLPYLLASGALRLVGDGLVARFGAPPLIRAGAVLAAAALALIVFAQQWPTAVLGFCLLGLGVAVVAPLSFSAAARIAGGEGLDPPAPAARVDRVIGRFNQFNYAGALLGSVLTGVAGAGSLRIGFAIPMVLVLALIPLAGAFASHPPQPVAAAQ